MTTSREELTLDDRIFYIRDARPDTGLDSKIIYERNISYKIDEEMLMKFLFDF